MLILMTCLNIATGAAMALAAKHIVPYEEVHRSKALGVLLSFQILSVIPTTAYFLLTETEWSLMYLMGQEALPVKPWVLLVILPLVAMISFLVARHLLVRDQAWGPWVLVAGGLGLVGALGWLGQRQLFSLTTAEKFDKADLGTSILDSNAGLMLVLALAVVLSTAIFSMYRLYVYSAASLASGELGYALMEEEELEGTMISP